MATNSFPDDNVPYSGAPYIEMRNDLGEVISMDMVSDDWRKEMLTWSTERLVEYAISLVRACFDKDCDIAILETDVGTWGIVMREIMEHVRNITGDEAPAVSVTRNNDAVRSFHELRKWAQFKERGDSGQG